MLSNYKIWIASQDDRKKVLGRLIDFGFKPAENDSWDIIPPYGVIVEECKYTLVGRYIFSKSNATELPPDVFMQCPYTLVGVDRDIDEKVITPEEFSAAANKMGYDTFICQDSRLHTFVVFTSPQLKKDLFYVDFATKTIEANIYMVYNQLLADLPNHISEEAFTGFKPETLVKAVILFIKRRADYITSEEILCQKSQK